MRVFKTGQEFNDHYDGGVRTFAGAVFDNVALSEITIEAADFRSAHFVKSHFGNVRFANCDFTNAQFELCRFGYSSRLASSIACLSRWHHCYFDDVTFSDSDFDRASFEWAKLWRTNMVRTSLRGAALNGAALHQVKFEHCDVFRLDISGASFHDCNIEDLCRAELADNSAADPVFDWRTIVRSCGSGHLQSFFVARGMPGVLATYIVDAASAVSSDLLFKLMRSTFISYGGPDAPFATRLADSLRRNGVRTFLFSENATPGEKLHALMHRAINEFDRVVLVCSSSSLKRKGVRNEIDETLAREARDGGVSYLIPVAIDDFIYHWTDPLAVVLRDRVVADFRRTAANPIRYANSLGRLLLALRRVDGA